MSSLWNFLTMPFNLPISPMWSYIGMAIIGTVACVIAYRLAGAIGGSSTEKSIIHWCIRIIVFVTLWAIACSFIYLYRFIAKYWIPIVIIAIVLIICAIVLYTRKAK